MIRRRWEYLLSVGSNIDPGRWVDVALDLVSKRFELRASSPRYVVPAVGDRSAPDFVNLALRVRTDLPPRALRTACRRIEERCGRRRSGDRFAPRTMDLDIVYGQGGVDASPFVHDDLLAVPHVLVPCADVWPALSVRDEEGPSRSLAEWVAARFPAWRAECAPGEDGG